MTTTLNSLAAHLSLLLADAPPATGEKVIELVYALLERTEEREQALLEQYREALTEAESCRRTVQMVQQENGCLHSALDEMHVKYERLRRRTRDLRRWAAIEGAREKSLWQDALPMRVQDRLPANGVGRLLGEPDPDIDGMQDDTDYPDED